MTEDPLPVPKLQVKPSSLPDKSFKDRTQCIRQVNDVKIITDSRSVRGWIITAENLELFQLPFAT